MRASSVFLGKLRSSFSGVSLGFVVVCGGALASIAGAGGGGMVLSCGGVFAEQADISNTSGSNLMGIYGVSLRIMVAQAIGKVKATMLSSRHYSNR